MNRYKKVHCMEVSEKSLTGSKHKCLLFMHLSSHIMNTTHAFRKCWPYCAARLGIAAIVSSSVTITFWNKTANSVLCATVHRLYQGIFLSTVRLHSALVNIISFTFIWKVQPHESWLSQNSQMLSNIMSRYLILNFTQISQ